MVQALRDFTYTSLQPLFVAALKDKAYQVYTSALDSLAKVGTPELLEQIKPFLDNQNPYVQMSAANAILAIVSRGDGAA